MSFDDFLSIAKYKHIWRDCENCLFWLTGLKNEDYVVKGKIMLDTREISNLINIAKTNMENCFWIGLFEDYDYSLQILSLLFSHEIKSVKFNVTPSYNKLSMKSRAKLERLIPIDMELYNFGRELYINKFVPLLNKK